MGDFLGSSWPVAGFYHGFPEFFEWFLQGLLGDLVAGLLMAFDDLSGFFLLRIFRVVFASCLKMFSLLASVCQALDVGNQLVRFRFLPAAPKLTFLRKGLF